MLELQDKCFFLLVKDSFVLLNNFLPRVWKKKVLCGCGRGVEEQHKCIHL